MKHAFIAVAAVGLLGSLSAQQPRPFDLLITHARIVDGTGGPSINAGTFPRVLGKYVRDEHVIPLEQAV